MIEMMMGGATDQADRYMAVGMGLVTTGFQTLYIVDLEDFSQINVMSSPAVHDIEFSPDGSLLAVATSGTPGVVILNTSDWSTVTSLNVSSVMGVSFSPNGEYLAVSRQGSSSPTVTVFATSDWGVVLNSPNGEAYAKAVFLNSNDTVVYSEYSNSRTYSLSIPSAAREIIANFVSYTNVVDRNSGKVALVRSHSNRFDVCLYEHGDWNSPYILSLHSGSTDGIRGAFFKGGYLFFYTNSSSIPYGVAVSLSDYQVYPAVSVGATWSAGVVAASEKGNAVAFGAILRGDLNPPANQISVVDDIFNVKNPAAAVILTNQGSTNRAISSIAFGG